MVERAPLAEKVVNPEIPTSSQHFAGLHPRLLMGGIYLDPAVQIETVKAAQLGNFQQRDYSPFSKASLQERRNYWSQRNETTYEARYQTWITNCVATFNNAKNFFENTDKGKRWSKLYSELGINTQNFTNQNAEALYNRYFQPNEPGLQQFVLDILSKSNMAELEANYAAIGWLSHIFGNVSSKVITQMVMAEARLLDNPHQLINQANSRQAANTPTRVNNLNGDEQRILHFLWQANQQRPAPQPKKPAEPAASPTPQPTPARPIPEFSEYNLRYKRLGEPRIFPGEALIPSLLDPKNIAAGLKARFPKYGHLEEAELVKQLRVEQVSFASWLRDKGLTEEVLSKILVDNINDYENFIKTQYGITLPTIEKVHIVPIWGKTAEYFSPSREPFAFVIPNFPMIFMDFGVIAEAARQIGRAEWRTLGHQQLEDLIVRLLKEIHPHESTHLTNDLAHWYLTKQTSQGEKAIDIQPGKMGLYVRKPIEPIIQEQEGQEYLVMLGRGRGLMEAVTVELTRQWAINMKPKPGRLDIPAYEAEGKVLYALRDLLASEQGISQDEAFKKVAVASFHPQGFRRLVEELSGKTVNPNIEVGQKGRISFKRPHFMQIIYALMEYERNTDYPLTLEYIRSADNLTQASEVLKGEISNIIRLSRQLGSNIQLSTRARDYLIEQVGIQIDM